MKAELEFLQIIIGAFFVSSPSQVPHCFKERLLIYELVNALETSLRVLCSRQVVNSDASGGVSFGSQQRPSIPADLSLISLWNKQSPK